MKILGNMISNMMVKPFQSPLWTDMDMVRAYYDVLGTEKELGVLDLESSRFAACDYLGRLPQEFVGWFDKHFGA